MSWSFASAAPQAGAQLATGADLEEITTTQLGFSSLAGETRLQLLPQAWPLDRLPPATSSLLSIASKKGLLAAAGPESLIVASTASVREAYFADQTATNNIKPFATAQATTLSIPRVSHVAFSADESCLVIAAEEGGGLAVYDTNALSGSGGPAFQMSTNGVAIRALAPNPDENFSHLFAVVLANGQLILANLKEQAFSNGYQIFAEGVTCVSWSAKGKQLVAGLQDGSAAQYDHQGAVKAHIPKPPQITDNLPLTTIYWIANDDFLVIHTSPSQEPTDSTYHLLRRQKGTSQFTSHKFLGDPCPAFGLRAPASHFISRLRSFPPSLDDMLILSSTAATDLGVISKSSVPLTPDVPAETITNQYTTTAMADDARRALLPMSADGMGDTSPIGMAIDLSSKDVVTKPIPQEEMDTSSTPVPALLVLNNEGVLSTWWVIYDASIREQVPYPGLISAGQSVAPAAAQSTTPAFGAASSMAPAFGKPAASAFGSPSAPAFGSPSAPAFGTPSAPAFGKASFGAPAALGGGKTSLWGSPSTTNAPSGGAATFGQPSMAWGGSAAAGSGFAKLGGQAGTSAFAASGSDSKPSQSPFSSFANAADKPTSSPFGSFGNTGDKPAASPFASFGKPADKPASSPFGSAGATGQTKAASPFSSFAQANDKSAATPMSSFASTVSLPSSAANSFGAPSTIAPKSPWGTPTPTEQTAASKEESMSDDGEAAPQQEKEGEQDRALPTTEKAAEQPKPSIFGQSASQKSPFASLGGDKNEAPKSVFGAPSQAGQTSGSIFGAKQDDGKPKSVFGQPSESASPFAKFKLGSTFKADGSAKDDAPPSKEAGDSLFGSGFKNMLGDVAKQTPQEPVTPIKKEPDTDVPNLREISSTPASPPTQNDESPVAEADDAPLPPDFVTQSPVDDAPLPPDFVTQTPKAVEEDLPPIAGSPPIDLGKDSGEEFSSPATSHGEEGDENAAENGPLDDGDESWEDDEEDEGEDDEDEGEDDEDDDDEEGDEDDEEEDAAETPAAKVEGAAGNAFGSRLSFPSQTAPQAPSTTPAGIPNGPVFFPPAPKLQESPRSPSPVRPTSFPAPLSNARKPGVPVMTVPPARKLSRSTSRPASVPPAAPQAPPEPEAGDLSDDEDQRIRELLQTEVEPAKDLEPFVAHQDYVGHVNKPGIGGQIEKVYRDINSMIDTLGLNARSLEAFVKGHETMYPESGRERSDLEEADDWCLVETDELGVVEKNIGDDLENGKVSEVRMKLDELSDLYDQSTRLRARFHDMRKQIAAREDPQQRANARAAPLNPEAQVQQSELRQAVTKVQELLREAEEALSILRADLASATSATSPAPGSAPRMPTVEAVTNTILKMTAMIEQKSGDVDVLEAQIRRLPRGLAALSLEDESDMMRSSVRSLNGRFSTTATPPSKRTTATGTPLGLSGMLGSRFRTPQGLMSTSVHGLSKSQSTRSLMFSPDGSAEFGRASVGSANARKKMSDVGAEEVRRYLGKLEQRKRVLAALKEAVEKKGPRVTRLEK